MPEMLFATDLTNFESNNLKIFTKTAIANATLAYFIQLLNKEKKNFLKKLLLILVLEILLI